MIFEKTPPTWNAEGTEPPSSLKSSGFSAGYKPPAAYFNWFWNKVSVCLSELQTKLSNVDNTSDADKPISSATQTALNGKADSNLSNVSDDVFKSKVSSSGAGGIPIGTATSTDGVNYECTIKSFGSLTNGRTIIIIPDKTSTSTTATLSLNGFSSKTMRQSVTYNSSMTVAPANSGWLVANKPVMLRYDNEYWVTVNSRPNANDLYGTISIVNGGTGATTAAKALKNLGITYGTTDLTAGSSSLETGKIYLCYE